MAQTTIDDIYKLIKGKPTKSKIGSRGFPHRLTMEEKERLELARKRGSLVSTKNSRINLSNIYYSICKYEDKVFICFYTDESRVEVIAFDSENNKKIENILKAESNNEENEWKYKVENIDRLKFKQFIMELFDRKD